jgi:hypothetical protein
VLGMQQVLSAETCEKLLAHINADSDESKAAVTEGRIKFDDKFGGVNCRGQSSNYLKMRIVCPAPLGVFFGRVGADRRARGRGRAMYKNPKH